MLDPQQSAALKYAENQVETPKAIERLAREFGPDIARWAFEQWSLRKRAKLKFPSGWQQMLFEREALEQATHQEVAKYRASRFPKGVLVADLTCSIGSDLIALARRGTAMGIDADSERLKLAIHNLAVFGLGAELKVGDCLKLDWTFDYAFADPARRINGKRTLDLGAFLPNPKALADKMSGLELGAIKLSPMLPDAHLLELSDSLEFWSYRGEAREAVLWFGRQRMPGVRAVHIESGTVLSRSAQPASVDAPKMWLFEADPAAVRADALGELCKHHDLVALGTSNGYLTGSDRIESPFLNQFRVLQQSKADPKSLQDALRALSSAKPTVKSRIPGFDASSFAKRFRLSGTRPLTIFLYPVKRSIRAVIAERP